MEWVWFVDRGTALLSYPVLLLAALTGIAAAVPAFGPLHRAAKKHHTPVSVLAGLVLLLHAGFGAADTAIVATGGAPVPGYGLGFLIVGAIVGLGAFIILFVATLAFLDPRRFERPWSPRVVHALSYAGFALATVHAAAIGTDVSWWMAQVAAGGLGLLALLALARLLPTGRGRRVETPPTVVGPARAAPTGAPPEPARDPSP
ncbi:MAG: hypothetical protein ACYC2H_03890 [Thermoplasmatota archaeon]